MSIKKDQRKPENSPDEDRISWHPAFVEAMKLELEDYLDSLEFYPEFQLTTEPLRIDCVVIKKRAGMVIRKNIASIFREVNFLEYKSLSEKSDKLLYPEKNIIRVKSVSPGYITS